MGRVCLAEHDDCEVFWQFHQDERARGTLNQREYCELHGLPLKRFGNWRARRIDTPQSPRTPTL